MAVSPCMLLLAEPRQLLCCPDPSPGTGFQSRSAGLSWAGNDRGSAKVCQSGGPVGGSAATPAWWILPGLGGTPLSPSLLPAWPLPGLRTVGFAPPFPSPPCASAPGSRDPSTLLVFLALLVHVARAAGSPPAPAPPWPPPFAPGVPVSLGCGAAMPWGHEGTAGCCGLVRGCRGCHARASHAGTNS